MTALSFWNGHGTHVGMDMELMLERTWNTSLLCAPLTIQENGKVNEYHEDDH